MDAESVTPSRPTLSRLVLLPSPFFPYASDATLLPALLISARRVARAALPVMEHSSEVEVVDEGACFLRYQLGVIGPPAVARRRRPGVPPCFPEKGPIPVVLLQAHDEDRRGGLGAHRYHIKPWDRWGCWR